MSSTPGQRAARRALDRAGQDVRLQNYDLAESGGRQTRSATSGSPHTVPARVHRNRRARTDRGLRETGEPEADVVVRIADDASGADSIRDGGGRGASEIDTSTTGSFDADYVVVRADDQDNGILALECERVT